MPVPRDIGRKHADLAVGDLARRAGVLPSHAAGRLALLQKTGLVNDQNGVIRRQVFERVLAHNIAQRIGIPAAPPQDRLLPPGTGSPAASARIQPVLRRSCPSSPSRNRPAEAATRSCVNNGRIRAFTSRSDAAQSSSVPSIDAPLIYPLPTTREKIRTPHSKCNCRASVMGLWASSPSSEYRVASFM